MARLGDVEFTAITDERVIRETAITDKPVEDGVNISDNTSPRPIQLQITGEITGENAQSAYEKLELYWMRSDILVYSGRTILKDLVITSLPTDEDARIRNGFRFTMLAQQVRITQTKTTSITIPDPATGKDPSREAAAVKDGGLQQAQPASSVSQSFLQRAVSWVSGMLFGGVD